jgi:hypothetical protein
MKKILFSNYCTPAYLNIALGVAIIISTFLAGGGNETIALEALFVVIWALGLKWLCSKGFKIISWSLAVVPVILALYMGLLVKDDVAAKEVANDETPEAKIPEEKAPDQKTMYEIVKSATETGSADATELAADTVRGINDVRGAATKFAAATVRGITDVRGATSELTDAAVRGVTDVRGAASALASAIYAPYQTMSENNAPK